MENTRKIMPNKFTWMDAYEAEGEWYDTDYTPTLRLMVTYGYPIAVTKDYISIASTYDPETESYACVINIPLGMLVNSEIVSTETVSEKAPADTETQHPHSQHPWQPQG
jgi:hypothetical protein